MNERRDNELGDALRELPLPELSESFYDDLVTRLESRQPAAHEAAAHEAARRTSAHEAAARETAAHAAAAAIEVPAAAHDDHAAQALRRRPRRVGRRLRITAVAAGLAVGLLVLNTLVGAPGSHEPGAPTSAIALSQAPRLPFQTFKLPPGLRLVDYTDRYAVLFIGRHEGPRDPGQGGHIYLFDLTTTKYREALARPVNIWLHWGIDGARLSNDWLVWQESDAGPLVHHEAKLYAARILPGLELGPPRLVADRRWPDAQGTGSFRDPFAYAVSADRLVLTQYDPRNDASTLSVQALPDGERTTLWKGSGACSFVLDGSSAVVRSATPDGSRFFTFDLRTGRRVNAFDARTATPWWIADFSTHAGWVAWTEQKPLPTAELDALPASAYRDATRLYLRSPAGTVYRIARGGEEPWFAGDFLFYRVARGDRAGVDLNTLKRFSLGHLSGVLRFLDSSGYTDHVVIAPRRDNRPHTVIRVFSLPTTAQDVAVRYLVVRAASVLPDAAPQDLADLLAPDSPAARREPFVTAGRVLLADRRGYAFSKADTTVEVRSVDFGTAPGSVVITALVSTALERKLVGRDAYDVAQRQTLHTVTLVAVKGRWLVARDEYRDPLLPRYLQAGGAPASEVERASAELAAQ